ncbi:hypothetical protein N9L77_07505 [Pseudomonadales bacterium]|nr:hypothetical protein [Pseudomonadales bacterium]
MKTDMKLAVNWNPSNVSRYDWSIEQLDQENKLVDDGSYFPLIGPLLLSSETATTRSIFAVRTRVHRRLGRDYDRDKVGLASSRYEYDSLVAMLVPDAEASFSVFLEDTAIESFRLAVHLGDNEEEATMNVVSASVFEGCIYLDLYLPKNRFNQLAELARNEKLGSLNLRLDSPQGFYVRELEFGVPKIKILDRSQELIIPDSVDISPPRIEFIDDFEISWESNRVPVHALSSRITKSYAQMAKERAEREVTSMSAVNRDSDHTVVASINDDRSSKLRNSTKYIALVELLTAVYAHRDAEQLGEDDLKETISDVVGFLGNLEYVFYRWGWEEKENDESVLTEKYVTSWQLWAHHDFDFEKLKEGQRPYIERENLYEAVDTYLQLPVRSKVVDRTLISSLIAVELYDYAGTIFVPSNLKELSSSPLDIKHPALNFLSGQLTLFLLLLVLPLGGLFLLITAANDEWLVGIGAIFAATWAGQFVLSLAFLPRSVKKWKESRSIALELVQAMTLCYSDLNPWESVSANQVLRSLIKAESKGVAWPRPIYPLIEDSIGRDGLLPSNSYLLDMIRKI